MKAKAPQGSVKKNLTQFLFQYSFQKWTRLQGLNEAGNI